MELQRNFVKFLDELDEADLRVMKSCAGVNDNGESRSFVTNSIIRKVNMFSWKYLLNRVQEARLTQTIEELGLNIDCNDKNLMIEKMANLFTGSMKNALWNFSNSLIEAYCDDLGIGGLMSHDILCREWILGGLEAIFGLLKVVQLREIMRNTGISIVPKNEKKKNNLVYIIVKAIANGEFGRDDCGTTESVAANGIAEVVRRKKETIGGTPSKRDEKLLRSIICDGNENSVNLKVDEVKQQVGSKLADSVQELSKDLGTLNI